MKKIFTFILAAVIAISFSVVGFAQDKPAAGGDQPKPAMEKAEKKVVKKHKKTAKKAVKKEEAAPAPAKEAAPAPAK